MLRYSKGTQQHGIIYKFLARNQTQHPLNIFSDADYANAKDRKSISGSMHNLNHSPITWASSKQTIIALSTTEAEYISATTAAQHTLWLQRLLSINSQTTSPEPTHYIDNKSAIQIAENQAPTRHRKFIDIRHHYLQHHFKNGNFTLQHILTGAMLTNKLTKPLQRQNFTTLWDSFNILHRQTWSSASPGIVRLHYN